MKRIMSWIAQLLLGAVLLFATCPATVHAATTDDGCDHHHAPTTQVASEHGVMMCCATSADAQSTQVIDLTSADQLASQAGVVGIENDAPAVDGAYALRVHRPPDPKFEHRSRAKRE